MSSDTTFAHRSYKSALKFSRKRGKRLGCKNALWWVDRAVRAASLTQNIWVSHLTVQARVVQTPRFPHWTWHAVSGEGRPRPSRFWRPHLHQLLRVMTPWSHKRGVTQVCLFVTGLLFMFIFNKKDWPEFLINSAYSYIICFMNPTPFTVLSLCDVFVFLSALILFH